MIETPNIPSDALGITDNHVRYTVLVRRDIWVVLGRQFPLSPRRRPVWRPVLACFDEAQAQSFLDEVPAVLRPSYCIAKGATWEAREVWIDRADLPDEAR